jgi:DNA invertase Pin-like site-specific DNA recombinase
MLHSLAAQVSYYSKLIQDNSEWIYAGVYADEAITGTKQNRPELKRLLDDCKAGRIDLVLIKSASRLARNTVDLLSITRGLKDIGVGVFFEEQNINTLDDEGELMLTIFAAVAEAESFSVSENCKWRIRNQFEKGELAGLRFMYGYKVTRGNIEIDPEKAAIVRIIFDDYINGMGGGMIAKKLTKMNIPPLRSDKWTADSIMAIIKNEKYTGHAVLMKKYVKDHLDKKLLINKGERPKYVARDTHPAIIDEATFEMAKEILDIRRSLSRVITGNRNRYPLSGMIVCGHCGKKYKRKALAGSVVWKCSTYLNKGKDSCPARQIPDSVLYETSAEVLNLKHFDEERFKAEISEILVPEEHKLIFVFRDGQKIEKSWYYKSRSDSWTTEMREAARTKARRH